VTLKVADQALYRAQAAGRDRYEVEPGVLRGRGLALAADGVDERHLTTEVMR
jgi:hypothetical protein